jgi:UTP--glucose-1-phosphate uridylyltransferase
LTPAILDILGKLKPGSGGEIQLTDAFTKHIKKQAGYACVYDGTYYDCGNKLEFVKATINFALKHPELRGPLKNYLKKL